MRKFYLFLILICLLLTSVPVGAHDFEVDRIYYNITGPESVEVTYKEIDYWEEYHDYYSGEVIIPETVIFEDVTYTVKAIGDEAFYHCKWLETVKMPETIEAINFSAFENCVGLTEIEIPDSVEYIGMLAFSYCFSLTNIKLPSFLEVLPPGTFYECNSLESVILPESLIKILSSAFSMCTSLKSIIIPDKVEIIDDWAFTFCEGMEYIRIGKSLRELGDSSPFFGCYNIMEFDVSEENQTFACYDGSLYSKDLSRLIKYAVGREDIVFAPGIIEIGEDAFTGSYNIREVVIPETVKIIGSEAFSGCYALERVVIGQNAEKIGSGAFLIGGFLSEVVCKNPVAPAQDPYLDDFIFDEETYETATLIVPEGSLESYCVTYPWKEFRHIVTDGELNPGPGEESLVVSPENPGNEQDIYDLNGRRVNPQNLLPGIYILNGRKFVVR